MNAPEWVVTQFAVGRIGAVLVNINPSYRLLELEDALKLADVATLIVGSPFKGSNFVQMVETLCPEVAAGHGRSTGPPHGSPGSAAWSRSAPRPGPGWIAWSDLEAASRSLPELAGRERQVRPGAVYNIQFTSGTTGLPKGAMLTHRNVLMNAYYFGRRLRYTAERPGLRAGAVLSLFRLCARHAGLRSLRRGPGRPGAKLRPRGNARRGRGRALHVALRCADDVRRRARPSRPGDGSTCRACGPGSWRGAPARCR